MEKICRIWQSSSPAYFSFQRFLETRSSHFLEMCSKGIGENSPTSHFSWKRKMSINLRLCTAGELVFPKTFI